MRAASRRDPSGGGLRVGEPEQRAAPGPERPGDPGVSRCSGSRGGREDWEWPLAGLAGERWEVRRPRAAGVRGDSGGDTEHGATPPPRAAVGGGRVCGVETLNELVRGGTVAPCPLRRVWDWMESRLRTLRGKAPCCRSWDLRLGEGRAQRESGSFLKQNGMEVRGQE